MTTEKKVARRKLSLLELAADLGNVSKACKVMGYSRQQFYEIRRTFQTYGADGLIDRLPGPRGRTRIGCRPQSSRRCSITRWPTPATARCGSRPGTRSARAAGVLRRRPRGLAAARPADQARPPAAPGKTAAERALALTDEQIRLLERFSPEFRERHIEAPHTGALVAVDTFFVGVLKGVGKVYPQTAIDCHSRYAWARLYPNKLPVTAVQLMNNDVLPTFEDQDASIDAVLSDNGREFRGRDNQHPYELFLQLEGIEHKTTRVKRPRSNGIAERFHRTLLDEHFRVEGRKAWFETIEEMQAVLDDYLVGYNTRRSHQGRGMNGRTPLQAFRDGIRKQQKETPTPSLKPAA